MAKRKRRTSSKSVPNGAFDQALISWKAAEYLRTPKGWLWYLIAGSINLALLAYAWWTASWTMGIVFVVLPIVFLLEHSKKPKQVEVRISAYGIQFGQIKLAYSQIRAFWILHEPPYVDELHLATENRLHPEVTIPLMGVDPTLLRQYLVTQIPEREGQKQSLLDILVRFLRLT